MPNNNAAVNNAYKQGFHWASTEQPGGISIPRTPSIGNARTEAIANSYSKGYAAGKAAAAAAQSKGGKRSKTRRSTARRSSTRRNRK